MYFRSASNSRLHTQNIIEIYTLRVVQKIPTKLFYRTAAHIWLRIMEKRFVLTFCSTTVNEKRKIYILDRGIAAIMVLLQQSHLQATVSGFLMIYVRLLC